MLRILLALVLTAPALAQPLPEAARLLSEGEPAAALDALADDSSQAAFFLRGRALADLARHGAASEAFARADTSERRVLTAWAASLEAFGRSADALGLLGRAYARDTTHAPTALVYGRHLTASRRYARADTVLGRMVRADSANAYLRARLAYVHHMLGRADDAVVGYEIALRLEPRDKGVLLALTRLYLDRDAALSAKRALDRVLTHHTDDPDVWRRGGEIAMKLEDYPSAVDHVQAAVALGDTVGPTLRMLGAAHYLDADYPSADTALSRAVRMQADDWLTTYYLGLTRLALEEYDTARGWLTRTTELLDQATLAEVHGYLGQIAASQERWADGIDHYGLARRLDPGRAAFRYRLATLYDAYYSDRAAVREAYRAFVASADSSALPDEYAHAQQRLRQLREQAHMANE